MPFLVSNGGGPTSGNPLSKCPARALITTRGNPVFSSNTGVQWIRSVDVASRMWTSPQYIQYLPCSFTACTRPLCNSVRIPADLYSSLSYLPLLPLLNAGPCFVQLSRFFDVAMPTVYCPRSRAHCVYVIT